MGKNSDPKVFIVVLNYNGKRTISRCLKSIYRSDYGNFEIIVVDNASKDGSLEMVRQNFQTAHVIVNQKNVGFAAGNNLGIRFALEKFADYVFVLNNDAYLEPSTISKLVTRAEKNPRLGILSPLIKTPENKIWFEGGSIDWFKMRTIHHNLTNNSSDYLCGCAMLVSKNVFRAVGLFDEKFFLYYEDADFSLRAKGAGFELEIARDTSVVHDEQSEKNKPQKVYWLVLSGIIFFKKHMPIALKPWLSFYIFLRKIKNRRDLLNDKNEVALAVRKAYQDAAKL